MTVVVNPATEQVVGIVEATSIEEADAAIARAQAAAPSWRDVAPGDRARLLRRFAEAVDADGEHLAQLEVANSGHTIGNARWEAGNVRDVLHYYAAAPERLFGRQIPVAGGVDVTFREPIGVVGVIVPWNFPLEITLNKLGPVLAMGNTCVLKPAPDTPWNATRLARLIAEQTDIPAGVVNIVTSSDHLVGEVISTSPDVDLVAFTGSTATGRRIMEAAAATLKPVFLELGGKSVNLFLDDADLEAALPSVVMSCMHGGQGCAIATRVLVPRSGYDASVELIAAGFAGWSYGDPTDPSNLQGPQVSQRQQERVLDHIAKGQAEGARIVTGGGVPAHLPKGYYVEPTLFADVDNAMTIAQEEIFGPVLVVIPYDDDDDAVRIANDSSYGLSGQITGGDLARAKAVARRIRTGTLGINGGVWYGADAPFGGYKGSGIGRQCGIEGLEIFTETKTVGWPSR